MDDLAGRLGIIFVAVVVASAIAWFLQRRARQPGRPVLDAVLPPGRYFFSSESCQTCLGARSLLERRLGVDGFTEYQWEIEPVVFRRIGVDEVPALLVVEETGAARLFTGRLEPGLSEL